ncbi:MAG: Secretion system C-terminal sorting domain [Bacteroidota bacterium]|jgi:hypothetical protein
MKAFYSLLIFAAIHTLWAQNPILGLARTTNPASVNLASLDPISGALTTISPTAVASSINLTGAAYDPYLQQYYFISAGGFIGVNANTGLSTGPLPLSNPIAPSYFDNFRFNTSDSTLYGLARRNVTNPQTGLTQGEMYLATLEPSTGVITQLSPSSIGQSYALVGSAIDPHAMLYYYSDGPKLIALDLYNGSIYSSATLSFPSGGQYFNNFTYNCADTTIYGLIRNTSTTEIFFGKVNPTTGVVTQISPQALGVTNFTVNGSSTIDPSSGTYYFVSNLNGVTVYGVSIQTGQITHTLPIVNSSGPLYFDMMRSPTDCFEAFPVRLNPAAGLPQSPEFNAVISPNPFTDLLQLQTTQPILNIQLLDMNGQVVFAATPTQAATNLTLELPQIASGTYVALIQTPTGAYRQLLVK